VLRRGERAAPWYIWGQGAGCRVQCVARHAAFYITRAVASSAILKLSSAPANIYIYIYIYIQRMGSAVERRRTQDAARSPTERHAAFYITRAVASSAILKLRSEPAKI